MKTPQVTDYIPQIPNDRLLDQALTYAKSDQLLVDSNNIIHSPGKFEGEHVLTRLFYEWFLDGDGADNESSIVFKLDATEKAELGHGYAVLTFSDYGFIHGYLTDRE
jgi:hypothetical protein